MRRISFFILIISFNYMFATQINKIDFLIPGGPGGGWDSTARNVGKVLETTKLVNSVSYKNISGNGGGTAISYLIDNAVVGKNILMVNSTPIVIRSLQKVFPQSFRDLTLIASIIADYQVLAVNTNSPLKDWNDILEKFKKNPRDLKIGGGSIRGSMDHIVSAQIFKSAGFNPNQVKYIAYDAGGKAFQALLDNKIDVLSTGLGEVLEKHKNQEVRIIAVTSDKPLKDDKTIPTFKSLGIDITFANWRGFFAAPGIDKKRIKDLNNMLKKMYESTQWEEIRRKNGWSNLYKPTNEFRYFLEEQEKSIDSIMKELGVL